MSVAGLPLVMKSSTSPVKGLGGAGARRLDDLCSLRTGTPGAERLAFLSDEKLLGLLLFD